MIGILVGNIVRFVNGDIMSSKLEEDFAEIKVEINKKVAEAAKALQEAIDIANKLPKEKPKYRSDRNFYPPSLFDLDQNGELPAWNDLADAIDRGGWRSSSLSC